MILRPEDIFTRRERDGRQAVFVSQDALVTNVRGLTDDYLRKRARFSFRETVKSRYQNQRVLPDTGANWRYATKRGQFYYDYERIPAGRLKKLPGKDELLELHKNCEKKDAQAAILSELRPYLDGAVKYLPAYNTCSDIQANNLARACAVLQYAVDYLGNQPPEWDKSFHKNLGAVIKSQGWSYLPKNYRRLKEKIDAGLSGVNVREIIKLPRQGITNRKPYDNKNVLGWIVHLRSLPQNYPGAYIARKVIQMAEFRDEQPPSFGWVEKFLARNEIKFLTGGKRHGKGKHGARYRAYIPIAGAIHAGDCWQMDGTRFNFIPHQSKDGKQRSLIIIAVRDVHSGDLIGYHFDTKEDRWGYFNALEMAVKNTGHLPYELVHDRFPGHNTPEWELLTNRMNHQGVKVTVTSTATGKSHVERCFGTMQSVFMQDSPWYYGEGVQSSRENAHRAPEYLDKARKQAKKVGFDFDMAWQCARDIVERYRDTKYSDWSTKRAALELSPRQMYIDSETPNVYELDDFRRVELFGTERPETIRNGGMIRMRVQKVEYAYVVDNYEVIKNYRKVAVCYDLEDMSKVYLFAAGTDEVNRVYLGEANEQRRIQMYGPKPELKALGKAKARIKKLEERRRADRDQYVETVAAEVDLLVAAVAPKTDTDAAQDEWVKDRMRINQDTYGEPRLPQPTEELTPVMAEAEPEENHHFIVRKY